jgi:transposase InsO family protein
LLSYFALPKSTYYHALKYQYHDPYTHTRKLIKQIFDDSCGTYGYRRVTLELANRSGISLDRKTVAKIMRQDGLRAKMRRKKRYSSYRGDIGRVCDNHLNRDFKAVRPAQKLVSDITQFHIREAKVYLSPLIDLYNGEVVSWRIGKSPNLDMTMGMIHDARAHIAGSGAHIHTDQGMQYQSGLWQNLVRDYGCKPSMSRKGNCLDNAPAESFFGRLKTEFSDGSDYSNPQHFMADLNRWIIWYNERRIKESLGGYSPRDYRIINFPSSLESVQ